MEQCKTCQGGCCRRYNIHLWGSDIIKICNTLKVDISFFTYAYHIEEDKIENPKQLEDYLKKKAQKYKGH